MRLVFVLGLMTACGNSHMADVGPDTARTDAARDTSVSDTGDIDTGAADDAGSSDAGGSRCEHPTDCTLIPASCCGDCGAYTRDDILSLHDDDVEEQRSATCGEVACPPCFTEPDPALQPTCESGVCGYIDLYDPAMDFTSEFTECTESDECVLRVVDCCPCGAEIRMDRLVAIRVDKLADFAELVCEPGTACDDCEPSYEPFFARCGADAPGMAARCRVDVVGP